MSEIKKATESEEEFIAKQEIENKRKLANALHAKIETEEKERLQKLHYMHCAKCGMDLHEVVYRGVNIDKCYNCGVIVLDDGELEKIAGKESTFIKSIVSLFQ